MVLDAAAGETVMAPEIVGTCVTIGDAREAGARVDAADSVGACVANGSVTVSGEMLSPASTVSKVTRKSR